MSPGTGDHALDHLHGDALGDLDADLCVLDPHDLADHTGGQNHDVIALQRGEHVLVSLHPLLLGADHQEVEQGEKADQRRDLEQHGLHPAGGGTGGGLGEGGRGEHRLSD